MPRTPATRLSVQQLDDRIVPAVINLTTHGATATLASGAIVQQVDAQPAGTGNINSFVRIQGGGGCFSSTEEGINTSGRPLRYDELSSPQFTHAITLDQVPVVTVNGVKYREFDLDINQKSSSPYLSLDEVKIYLKGSGTLTRLSSLGTPVFDALPGCEAIKLSAKLNPGSGVGDMRLLVPDAAFAGASGSSFLYLYSKFGGLCGAGANGGFEEWSSGSVSQPTGGSISGTVFLDGNGNGTFDAGEGVGNLLLKLVGSDAQGNPVTLSVLTNADGSYTLNGVPAGTYSLIESDARFDSIDITSGTAGGTADTLNDQMTDINLAANQNASGYFFNVVFSE